MFIDLISDTVTKPTPEMLQAMMHAEVGDDVFGTDPTINKLEALGAEMFGHEASLFCPSGTMTNQIAIKTHTKPLDEVITSVKNHIYQSEVGVYSLISGVSVTLLQNPNGKLDSELVEKSIKPPYDWLPRTRLVVAENTINHAGGAVCTLAEMQKIKTVCVNHGLSFHLDGARLFNALVETKESTTDWGNTFDSISICLSKGLGAPVGSLLIGKKDFIKEARRYRKALGGGMRQAGFLAAAGIYALENNIARLADDNVRAKKLGGFLKNLPYVTDVRPVMSNIVIFDIDEKISSGAHFLNFLKESGVTAVLFGPQTVRFVTHLHITDEMIKAVEKILETFKK
mgnify:CR=1 FL=1